MTFDFGKYDDTSIQPPDNDDLNEIKKIQEKKEMANLSSVVMLGCISAVLLSLILITVNSPAVEVDVLMVIIGVQVVIVNKYPLEKLIIQILDL